MFGKLFGKIVASPFRVVNIPLKVASKATDAMCGERDTPSVKSRDPLKIDEIADAVEDALDFSDD